MHERAFKLYLLKYVYDLSMVRSELVASSLFKDTLSCYSLKNLDEVDLSTSDMGLETISDFPLLLTFIRELRKILRSKMVLEENTRLISRDGETSPTYTTFPPTFDEGLDCTLALVELGFLKRSAGYPWATTAVIKYLGQNKGDYTKTLEGHKKRVCIKDLQEVLQTAFQINFSLSISLKESLAFPEAFSECQKLSFEGIKSIDIEIEKLQKPIPNQDGQQIKHCGTLNAKNVIVKRNRKQPLELYLLKCAHHFSINNKRLEASDFFRDALNTCGFRNLDELDLSQPCGPSYLSEENLLLLIRKIRATLCKDVDRERNTKLLALRSELLADEDVSDSFPDRALDEGLDCIFAMLELEALKIYISALLGTDKEAIDEYIRHTNAITSAIRYLTRPEGEEFNKILKGKFEPLHPSLPFSLNLLPYIYSNIDRIVNDDTYLRTAESERIVDSHCNTILALSNCLELSCQGLKAIDAEISRIATTELMEAQEQAEVTPATENDSKKQPINYQRFVNRLSLGFCCVSMCASFILISSTILLICGDAGMLASPTLARTPLLQFALENSYSSLSSYTSAQTLNMYGCGCAVAGAGSASIIFCNRKHLPSFMRSLAKSIPECFSRTAP